MAYLETVPKTERKVIGQFFTPLSIAEYMGGLSFRCGEKISILDPGAGSGLLSAALIDRLVCVGVKYIELDLYENNEKILPLLNDHFVYIKDELAKLGVALSFRIIGKNFIEENQFAWTGMLPGEKYDIVISNPPYKKIGKDALEARVMSDIVYGQPNLYFLFMAMGARLLRNGGEFIYIVPRSFSSGLYFTAFRKWFLSIMRITNLHLFTSREAVGGKHDSVLQETIILRAEKKKSIQQSIVLTESGDEICANTVNRYSVDYNTCVDSGDNAFLFFPICGADAHVLDFVNHWPATLPKLGYRLKTGIVVDFRETEWMCTEENEATIPLLWACNFDGSRIRFPASSTGKPQYLVDAPSTKRLQMNAGNYILLKRFTAKEERRRLQCALLFRDDFSGYNSISTENHLNFIVKMNGDMQKEEMYGLFAVLNSRYLERYFRILNGSTQVNANEINSIPFPSLSDLLQIGKKAMLYPEPDEALCDALLEEQFIPAAARAII